MNYDYQSICRDINEMASWQHTAVCAVCLEKVTPIIRVLGLPATWDLVQRCLAFTWLSTKQQRNEQEGLELLTAIEATPEWDCDDPTCMPHLVATALSFARFALRAANAHASSEQATKAIGLLLDFADPFDFVAAQYQVESTGQPVRVPMVESEELSQERIITMLKTANEPSTQLLSVLRQEATSIAQMFGWLLPMYCYDYIRRGISLTSSGDVSGQLV